MIGPVPNKPQKPDRQKMEVIKDYLLNHVVGEDLKDQTVEDTVQAFFAFTIGYALTKGRYDLIQTHIIATLETLEKLGKVHKL